MNGPGSCGLQAMRKALRLSLVPWLRCGARRNRRASRESFPFRGSRSAHVPKTDFVAATLELGGSTGSWKSASCSRIAASTTCSSIPATNRLRINRCHMRAVRGPRSGREERLAHVVGVVVFARLLDAIVLEAQEEVVAVGVALAVSRERLGPRLHRDHRSLRDYRVEGHVQPVGKPALHDFGKPLEKLIMLLHLDARRAHHELEFEILADKAGQHLRIGMVHLVEKGQCALFLSGSVHHFLPRCTMMRARRK